MPTPSQVFGKHIQDSLPQTEGMALERLQEGQGQWGRHPDSHKEMQSTFAKLAKRLESAMASQKWLISSLTAKNENTIMALFSSGIEIPDSDHSSDEEDGEDCKMAANKKNSNLTLVRKVVC